MIETVIFDLDGLLIQSEIVAYELYCQLLEEYGHSFTLEDYAAHYSGGTAKGNMIAIIERFQLPITMQEGLDFVAKYEKVRIERGIPLHKGAVELLQYLKEHHYQIILGTSSLKERAEKVLSDNGILDYFENFAYGPEVEHGKPAPDIFLKALERSGNTADKAVVMEDSENGILAASRAGMRVFCVPDVKVPSEKFLDLCEAKFDTLADMIDYLEKYN